MSTATAISNSEEPYHFVRQSDSEEIVKANDVDLPTGPFVKKSITAGEAKSKLNNILDAQSRLRAFELPNDRPGRKVPRSEPISGSVRLAQLVSLERELKEAIYLRSLETPWAPAHLREKLAKIREQGSLAEEFSRQLAEENTAYQRKMFDAKSKAANTSATGEMSSKTQTLMKRSENLPKSKSRWPWAFPGKQGRKLWEPFPETYLKPGQPWTELQEKPSNTYQKLARDSRQAKAKSEKSSKTKSTRSKSKSRQVKKSRSNAKPKPERWDPATHRRPVETVFSNLAQPLEFGESRKLKTKRAKFSDLNTGLTSATTTTQQSQFKLFGLPTTGSENDDPSDAKPRSGFFRMPPLRPISVEPEEEEPPEPTPETCTNFPLEIATVFNQGGKSITTILPSTNANIMAKSKLNMAASVFDTKLLTPTVGPPTAYPKPWQFFKFDSFGERWDPAVYKPSGSAWENSTSGKNVVKGQSRGKNNNNKAKSNSRVRFELKSIKTPDSMDMTIVSDCTTRDVSTTSELIAPSTDGESISTLAVPSQRQIPTHKYSEFSTAGKPTLSTIFTYVTKKLEQISNVQDSQSKSYYIDRGLERALADVQKAIKTAIPTFTLDKSNQELTAHELKTEEWMNRFVDEMTHTPPHKNQFPHKPLASRPRSKRYKTGVDSKPGTPPKPYVSPKMIPNTENPFVLFIVNGKPQIPESTVGTHMNTYSYPPCSIEHAHGKSQCLTRCTICRPYGHMDEGPDSQPIIARKFCRNIPLPGFRDCQIFFKVDILTNKLIVNATRPAKGEECYRNVTQAIELPDGITALDLEIFRSDKGTLFLHDAKEELAIQRRLLRENELKQWAHEMQMKMQRENIPEHQMLYSDYDYVF